jgi:hypothetical protein
MNWLKDFIERVRRKRPALESPQAGSAEGAQPEVRTSVGLPYPPCPRCGVIPLNWDVHAKVCAVVAAARKTDRLLVGMGGVAPGAARPTRKLSYGSRAKKAPARENALSVPEPQSIGDKTCHSCGGRLVLIQLYNCEPSTDVITPAELAEKCLQCGGLTIRL